MMKMYNHLSAEKPGSVLELITPGAILAEKKLREIAQTFVGIIYPAIKYV